MDENDLYETYISYDQEQKYLIFRLHKRQDINIINEQSLSLKQEDEQAKNGSLY